SVWLPQLRKLPPAGARIVLLKWMGNCSETCRKNCPLKGLAPVFGVDPKNCPLKGLAPVFGVDPSLV
ncbi:hypothetical protein, partial [Desulfovibrio legallii]|uniref:hypothetical protein n=1 Tax=Desulfovibrio legallii TaxID=571438 RepID=UPI003A8CED1A